MCSSIKNSISFLQIISCFLVTSSYIILYSAELKDQELYITSGKILFTSEAPQETIKGIGKIITGKANLKTAKIDVSIDLKDWKTGNKLRDSHMHENYLETEKYPKAFFYGSIIKFDAKTGNGKVVGSMTIHGVTKNDFLIEGKIENSADSFIWKANFKINLKDFDITIPKLLYFKLNEVILVEIHLILKIQH